MSGFFFIEPDSVLCACHIGRRYNFVTKFTLKKQKVKIWTTRRLHLPWDAYTAAPIWRMGRLLRAHGYHLSIKNKITAFSQPGNNLPDTGPCSGSMLEMEMSGVLDLFSSSLEKKSLITMPSLSVGIAAASSLLKTPSSPKVGLGFLAAAGGASSSSS